MIEELQWPSLRERRAWAKAEMLFRIVNGLVDIPMPFLYTNFKDVWSFSKMHGFLCQNTTKEHFSQMPLGYQQICALSKDHSRLDYHWRLISECTELEQLQATAPINPKPLNKPGIILSSSPASTIVKVKSERLWNALPQQLRQHLHGLFQTAGVVHQDPMCFSSPLHILSCTMHLCTFYGMGAI